MENHILRKKKKKKKLFLKELDGKNDATHTRHTYEYVISCLLDVHKNQWLNSWPIRLQEGTRPCQENSLVHYPASWLAYPASAWSAGCARPQN